MPPENSQQCWLGGLRMRRGCCAAQVRHCRAGRAWQLVCRVWHSAHCKNVQAKLRKHIAKVWGFVDKRECLSGGPRSSRRLGLVRAA